jgi:hypothetical protein
MLPDSVVERDGKRWNTKPERLFNDYQRSRELGLIQNVTLTFPVVGVSAKTAVRFQLDFARPVDYEVYAATGFHDPNAKFDVDFEIDGSGHFRPADPWKDKIKNLAGMRVVHVDGRLCEKKQWERLDSELGGAIASGAFRCYIPPKTKAKSSPHA